MIMELFLKDEKSQLPLEATDFSLLAVEAFIIQGVVLRQKN
jgi:hypothetical protein